jgi:hypothetical protein
VLERPRWLESRTDPAHGAVEDGAVMPHVLAAEVEERRDGAAEGLAVEEAGERGRVVGAEGREGGVAVVERCDSEPRRGEVDGGELDHLAGLAGEAVHDGDGAEDRVRASGVQRWVKMRRPRGLKKRPGEPASAPLSQAKMLRHFLAYQWSQTVGCFEQRASRAEGAKNDAKHEFEPMRVQPSPIATLPNAP